MARFSERYGYVPARLQLQLDDMDRGLRIALWGWFVESVVADAFNGYSQYEDALEEVWAAVLLLPIDELPSHRGPMQEHFKPWFLKGKWHTLVDAVELIAQRLEPEVDEINEILEANQAGYRFVGGQMVQISDKMQVEAVNAAVEAADDGLNPARKHLSRAVELFSERPKPDYRNTIKEAISAAESAACIVMHTDKFDTAVKKMVQNGTLHPAMQRSMSALFGYTSDEQGVRHGFTGAEDRVDYPEALFVLVTCSAFLTYVAEHLRRLEGS